MLSLKTYEIKLGVEEKNSTDFNLNGDASRSFFTPRREFQLLLSKLRCRKYNTRINIFREQATSTKAVFPANLLLKSNLNLDFLEKNPKARTNKLNPYGPKSESIPGHICRKRALTP